MNDTPGLLVLYNLLSRASVLPCSSGTRAFLSLLTTEDDWLSLAVDGFIPALQNQNIQIPQRILAAYVLHALYFSHDQGTIPFYDHLLRIFESERAIAIAASHVKSSHVGSSQLVDDPSGPRMQATNEQLVWVLWKLLRGESDDLAHYSPNMLSQTTMPENFRPVHLVVHGRSGYGNANRINSLEHPLTDSINSNLGPTGATTSLFHSAYPLFSRLSHTPGNPAPAKSPSKTTFSPFDDANSESGGFRRPRSPAGQMLESNGCVQDVQTDFHSRQSPEQPSLSGGACGNANLSDFSHAAQSQMNFDHMVNMSQTPFNHRVNENDHQRGETLLRTISVEPSIRSCLGLPQGGMLGAGGHPSENCTSISSNIRMSRHFEPHSQLSMPSRPYSSSQRTPPRSPMQVHSGIHNPTPQNAFDSSPVASSATGSIRPHPNPISRPQSRTPSQHTAPANTGASASAFQDFSANELKPHTRAAQLNHKPLQETLMPVNGSPQQPFGIPFVYQRRIPTPAGVPQPPRSPGVIGSGRPSTSIPRRVISTDKTTCDRSLIAADDSRHSFPVPPMGDIRQLPTSSDQAMSGVHRNMIPFSVLCMQSGKEGKAKTQLDAPGESMSGLGDGKEHGVVKLSGLTEELASLSLEQKQQQLSEKMNMAVTEPIDSTGPPNRDNINCRTKSSPLADVQPLVPPKLPSSEKQHNFVSAPVTHCTANNKTASVEPPQPCTGSSSDPPIDRTRLIPSLDNTHTPPEGVSEQERFPEAQVNDRERNELTHAIILLLSARERVLTLSEQRVLHPHLLMLTQPISLLRPRDLPQLIAKNPDVAAKLLVFLLDRSDEDAANIEQLLRDVSSNDLKPVEGASSAQMSSASSGNSLAAVDAIQAVVKFISACGAPSEADGWSELSPFGGREAKEGYLDALRKLPPTLQSFNLIARLLNPTYLAAVSTTQQQDAPEVRVATLIRIEVLGGFVSQCVSWIEGAEQQEKEGEVHDDRVAVAISNLCRFYSSLLKRGFVSAASEADTTEIMRFALQFSRFEEARSLYSTLAAGRA